MTHEFRDVTIRFENVRDDLSAAALADLVNAAFDYLVDLPGWDLDVSKFGDANHLPRREYVG